MNKIVLKFVNACEAWGTAIQSLHWDAANMSQHKLCDDIASDISEFKDQVAEVEQSISGNLPLNKLNPTHYKITTLIKFVNDVIDTTKTFYKSLKGDDYIGMRSDCEAFLSKMQRNLYLVRFTIKEDIKRRLKRSINESRPKSLTDDTEVERFMGRRPKSIKARINQIYRIIKKYGIDSRIYHDEHWQAIDDYHRAISSLGCEVDIFPCTNLQSNQGDGGYTDYDASDNMPRSKQYKVIITYDDGMQIEGYTKMMAAGTVSDPFSAYDTCMVLWPKNSRLQENCHSGEFAINESDLKSLIKNSTIKVLKEVYGINISESKSPIHIDPKNKGKFNATKKATGKSTEELTHSKNPLTRKRAIFAQNARKWNKK